jgi:rhamnosyl/mannosyltransferase
MHIVHIYKDYYPVLGGIENHIKALAEGLAARGHRVTVLVTNTAPHDAYEQQGNLTIIKAGRLLHTASTPLSPRMLWHARRMRDVDIAHLQFPYPPGDLAYMALPQRPPLVIYYHSDIVRQKTLLRAYRPLLRWTLDHATRIIASNPGYIASSPWLAPRADRCEVIPLSADPQRFAQADPAAVAALRARYGAPLVLFVGKLRYYKGLPFLLEALTQLRSTASLLIVGSGPEEQHIRGLVQTLGLAGRVHLLGEVDDAELPAIYHAADVFVLPSHLRAEAFGIVQIEAQAAGLPLISTELGTGTSYVNQHGQTGFVVPPANPAALARALDVLLHNPDLARRMGAAGQARALHDLSHTRMVERMEDLYSRLLAARSR